MGRNGPQFAPDDVATADDMVDALITDFQKTLNDHGLDAETCARKAEELLQAETVTQIKLSGPLLDAEGRKIDDIESMLPPGYHVVLQTTEQTLIEYRAPNYVAQQKELHNLEKLHAFYPTEKVEFVDPLASVFIESLKELHKKSAGLPPLQSMAPDDEEGETE